LGAPKAPPQEREKAGKHVFAVGISFAQNNPRFRHTQTRSSPLATDGMFELLDEKLLKVASRNDAYKSATFDHRDMTHGS
jgi:hypothetical protein